MAHLCVLNGVELIIDIKAPLYNIILKIDVTVHAFIKTTYFFMTSITFKVIQNLQQILKQMQFFNIKDLDHR